MKFRKATYCASWFIAFLAFIGSIAWVAGAPRVGLLGTDFPPIRPGSILVLFLMAMALRELGDAPYARRRVTVRVLAALIVAIALVSVAGEWWGTAGGVAATLGLGETLTGSIGSAVTFLLFAAALASATVEDARARATSQFLSYVVVGLGFAAVVGMTFRMVRLDIAMPSIGMSLLAALAVIAAGVSLMIQPVSRVVEWFDKDTPGGGVVRRLLPVAIALPLLIGWFQALGQRAGWFESIDGEGVLTVFVIVAAVYLIFWTSSRLDEMNVSRAQAEARADTHRQWLEATLANIHDVVVTVTSEKRISVFNPAAQEMFGLGAEEAVGRDLGELLYLVDERNGEALPCPLAAAVEQGRAVSHDEHVALSRADGSTLAVELVAAPIRSDENAAAGGVLVLRDVSAKRAAAQAEREAYAVLDRRVAERTRVLDRTMSALRESTTLLRTIAASTPELIIAKDRDRRIMMVNAAALQAIGRSRAQVIGRRDEELLRSSEEARCSVENDRQVIESGAPLVVEETWTTRSGARTFLVTKSPLRDAQGEVFGVVGVAKDITERKQAQQELERLLAAEHRLRGEAERANRAKDEFLAIVSHELRSPLNALKGWSQVLLGAGARADAALVTRGAEAIKRSVDHQARLIDDLLDTSRIISGNLELSLQPLDLVALTTATIGSWQEAARAREVELRLVAPDHSLTVNGEPERLRQIANHLLSNAIKFSPEGGCVEVGLRASGDHVELSISDTGFGIEPDFLPHMFEHFSQADTSMKRRHQGLGLGLALVRNLVELHHGSIRADSDGPGRGALFTVSLPKPVTESGEISRGADTARANAHVLDGARPLDGVLAWVVDDDPDAREVVQMMLENAGASVRSFPTGDDLLSDLRTAPASPSTSILLLDIAMPGDSGFEVLARVRSLAEQAFVPAIAVTAMTHFDPSVFRLAGFEQCVGKPLDESVLIDAVAAVLAPKHA